MVKALELFDPELKPVSAARGDTLSRPPQPREPATAAWKPTLLAVDGNALVHRAFHAYRATRGGARYGFFALLAVVCDQIAYDGLLIGFDCTRRSYRRERYPPYKRQRPDKDPELEASLEELPDIAADLGACVVVHRGWEADDVVASAAVSAGNSGWRCVVASPDRDVLGLVTADSSVLQVKGGRRPPRMVTEAGFRRRYRIEPGQYPQLAALQGDSSDNLPGVPGIGRVKAAALLAAYPTVEAAVADALGCRSVLGPELGQALIDDLEAEESVFRRNLELMTLCRDLPIDLETARPSSTPERIDGVLRRWRMTGLQARMAAALSVRPEFGPARDEP